MAAGEPVPGAGPAAPRAETPSTYPYPARTSDELERRRQRYAWLYDDEDLWAAPAPAP